MGKIIIIKVTDKQQGVNCEYHNKINFNDANVISLVLEDLQNLGAPMRKACKEFLDKGKIYPFSP
jgi:hypothetical protein